MAVIIGTESGETLNGTPDPDTISGLGGNDVLNGGAGADSMDGGIGNDTFYVDNSGDLVIEATGGGLDRVAASVSYALAGAAEIEVFEAITQSATTALDLVGNNFNQRIVGNNGNNLINAGGGNDVLIGLAGNDTLIGSPGSDTMYGGTGNDVYFVESTGDVVVERDNEGTDRVATSVSYVLPTTASIETLETTQLAGTAPINLTGSYSTRFIIGNDGDNILQSYSGGETYGGGGNDVLIGNTNARGFYGGTGDDAFFVLDVADQIVEYVGEGNDRVAINNFDYTLNSSAEVERMEPIDLSSQWSFSMNGNQFAQTIIGNGAYNRLDGRGGSDVLVGRGGNDLFAFTTALGSDNVDRIEDFRTAFDEIEIDRTIFAAVPPHPTGELDPGAFHAGNQAHDADDRIIYDPASGALFYDPDGTGATAQVQFAVLTGAPTLVAADFMVV